MGVEETETKTTKKSSNALPKTRYVNVVQFCSLLGFGKKKILCNGISMVQICCYTCKHGLKQLMLSLIASCHINKITESYNKATFQHEASIQSHQSLDI